MATCMAFYVDGSVLVLERQAEHTWLAAKAHDGVRIVEFGDVAISKDPDNPPVFPREYTTVECLYALAAIEGIERITVNGEQVFPLLPKVVEEDPQE